MRVAKVIQLIVKRLAPLFKRELILFSRATLIAMLSAATYILVALLLNGALGISQGLAAQVAVVMSAVVSYVGHVRFSFSTGASNRWQIIRYLCSFAVTSLISWSATSVVIPYFELKYWQGLVIVAGVVPAFNYVLLRFFVFRLVHH